MTENLENESLEQSSRQKLEQFNKIRGVQVSTGGFWDVVVITAVDHQQKFAYELQIQEKLQRKELPLGLQYLVFSDPPGYKIGNGGSTLHALHELTQRYGASLSKLKIILIHAGGLSQRLPHASALGKIFMGVPVGVALFQMLDVKLATYVLFPRRMHPGVLVTCADDLQLYSARVEPAFLRPGFTALAHPSALSVGTTHGVFVLEGGGADPATPRDVEYRTCSRFLHKPSVDAMRRSGAVFRGGGAELVYTDSTFYMDHAAATALLALFREIRPLTCEVDAYGDFLQSLGPGATPEHLRGTVTTTTQESELLRVREKIFHHLSGMPLNVVVLNRSKFYHLGTMEEHLHHLTRDALLRAELGLRSCSFSVLPPGVCEAERVCEGEREGVRERVCERVCVMHSVVGRGCRICEGSVVEYSRLDPGVTVAYGSMLSACWVESGLSVPPHTFLHTLSLRGSHHAPGFVTVAFGVMDDLKKTVPGPAHTGSAHLDLLFLGGPLREAVRRWGWDPEGVAFSGGGAGPSLWTCRLFCVCGDMRSSFSSTLLMVRAARGGGGGTPQNTERLSLHDVLQRKDLENMLKFRRELFEEILQNKV